MSDRFITKQRTHAEEKKLGRTERYCEITDSGKFKTGTRRMDAKKNPPLVVAHEVPVGRARGVAKPGS